MKAKASLVSAKKRLLSFLEREEGITDVGAFYQYGQEDTYFLEVFIPGQDEWEFLKRLDSILTDIANQNDFVIGVIPLPLPVGSAK
jgi:hypothetical protein